MSLRIGALLALTLVATACSSYRIAEPRSAVLHPFAPIPSEFARVCVIRTSHYAQALTFTTADNGTLVGATKGPTFFCYKAEPGRHELRFEADETTSLELVTEGGKSYYVHETIPFAFITRVDAVLVSELVAHDLVDDSTYEVITEGPSNQKVPDAIPYAKAAAR